MQTNHDAENIRKSSRPFIVLIVLLILRICNGVFRFILDEYSIKGFLEIFEIYELVTFAGIAFLIWFERERLEVFHIDSLGIILFLFFGTLLRTNISESPIIFLTTILFLGISITLILKIKTQFVALIKHDINISHALIGGITGTVLGIVFSITYIFLVHTQVKFSESTSIFSLIILLFHEFSHASIIEEPVFRGFLWGYLRLSGWKENRIWLFQAALFWIVHLNYLNRPWSFWVAVPIMSIILGGLVWRYRSISTSMVAHSFYNWVRYFFPLSQ